MSVTIKDVAKKANVSISTVSRVINDSKPVSDDVKKRVLEVIKETGYTPNPVARSLVMKKSRLIGVVVPDISSFFIGEVLNAMEEIAKTYGYDILLCNSYGELDQEIKFLNLMRSKQVEGIVFMTYKIEPEHKEFTESADLPMVLINRYSEDIKASSVTVDHLKATYEMTKYLVDQGHSDIALVRNGTDEDIFIANQLEGYRKALEEAGISFRGDRVINGNYRLDQVYQNINELIELGDLPTAIFATSDENAIGAMNALLDKGYRVPEDISIVSFHDTKVAQLFRPKLTAISQPIYDIGAVSIRLLIKKIKGEEKENTIHFMPHKLVVRGSSQAR